MEYVISVRGKKNSKTCDSQRYQFNQLNFFKMLQNNLNLEYVEINIIVQKTHLPQNMNFVKRKKKERNFHFQIMKNFFGSGLFSMGSSDKGKQKYFIFGPTMFLCQFLFMNTVLARIFGGFMLPDNTVYLLPCPWSVSSKSGSLKIKTSSWCL